MRLLPNRRMISLLCVALPWLLGNKGCEPDESGTAEGSKAVPKACAGSDCSAAQAGSTPTADATVAPSADAQVPNDSKSSVCGTRGAVACASGEFCNFAPDAECGATDRGGRCEPTPESCTTQLAPVCGCDNRSHDNECGAHRQGVSSKHSGLCTAEECKAAGGRVLLSPGGDAPACDDGEEGWYVSGGIEPSRCCVATAQPKTCGGIAALSCAASEFCNYEPKAGGQGCDGTIADAAGVCTAKPDGCTKEHQPVCGCDRRSYGNACSAHAEGASVLHEGACTELDCKALGGRAVDGLGPAPKCEPGETLHTWLVYSTGGMAIEGTACCLPGA